jgi:hypothetical protein
MWRGRQPLLDFISQEVNVESNGSKQGWWSRNWKWFVPVACLAALVLCIGCIAIFVVVARGASSEVIESTDVCQMAMTQLQANAQAVEALGTPIEIGGGAGGSYEVTGPSGSADLSIPVSGPQGSGTLYVVANKSAGIWRFDALELAVEGVADRIDLLADR